METLTLAQVCKSLGIVVGTGRNRLCKGDDMPPHFKSGRKLLFPRTTFEEWIEKRIVRR